MNNKISLSFLMGTQLVLALVFGFSQGLQMLKTTEGVSISVFIFAFIFISLNLFLLTKAFSNAKKEGAQDLIFELTLVLSLYWLGLIVYGGLIIIMLIKSPIPWVANDWYTTLLVVIGVFVSLPYLKIKYGLKHPYVKGTLAALAKGIPQLFLAYKIFQFGGDGYSVVAIWVFHVMTCMRIGQVGITWIKNRDDKNITSTLFSELFNEGTWVVVTIIWYLV